jgi:type II secretory pathway component PulK
MRHDGIATVRDYAAHPPRRAVVLGLGLIMVALLSLAGLGFAELMLLERKGAQNSAMQVQSRALAESGVEAARQLLSQKREVQDQNGGWYDNPQWFRGVLVVEDDDPRHRGRFTLVAPRVEDRVSTGLRFGLENESARINLRTILQVDQSEPGGGRKMLMKLPGMTESIADALLDWMDADDTAREFGAEQEYYSSLTPAYAPRNGLPTSIDELLLVRGVTSQLLYGVDLDRNGRVDSDEPASNSLENVDNSDFTMDRGWAAYLTLYSQEKNIRPDGTPKINVNGDDLQKLYDDLNTALDAQWATFIVAYRQNGPAAGGGGGGGGGRPGQTAPVGKLDLSQKATTTLTNVLDLVGSRTQAQFEGQKQKVTLQSPIPEDRAATDTNLLKLMDTLAMSEEATTPSRININLAPRTVLQCIPELTPDVVEQIIGQRIVDPLQTTPSRRYETWLLSEGIVPLATMKKLMPRITAGGDVYRVQAIGYFEGGGPATRLEIVLDATKLPPRIVSWKELTSLGRGYLPQTLTDGTGE